MCPITKKEISWARRDDTSDFPHDASSYSLVRTGVFWTKEK